jgi:K+-transporting ATPase ATPase C chain
MQEIRPAIMMLIVFTLICGGIYPALVTGAAQALFPDQANGSLITDKNGKVLGSSLVGQPFSDPHYFWPRPSASADFPSNPAASGGSNAGPTNPEYLKTVAERVKALRDSGVSGSLPADLVQASASGLDPHISPESALVQIPRVARARNLSADMLKKAVAQATQGRQFGFLGAPGVQVLELNQKLDALK